jgi:putative hydroxymethylpyrimidine transport system ATP-binding protein
MPMSVKILASSKQEPTIAIEINKGCLRYLEREKPTLVDLNMSIPASQWTCILGPSGCGKTTLLRYLLGLLDEQVASSFKVQVKPDGSVLKSNIAYMAQQDLLMPWLPVLSNVLLSTKFGSRIKSDISHEKSRAMDLLEQVGLANNANDFPNRLSGGMRQRAALARTLMQNKPVVFMDEPFSALDAVTRYKLQELAYRLLVNKTVVLITHDPQEAIRLGHNVYIMQGSPSTSVAVPLVASSMPRKFDAESARLQQNLMSLLARDGIVQAYE